MDGGAFFLSPVNGSYVETISMSPDKVLATPHVFGLTQELAHTRMSWISSLFHYDAPQIGFSLSEQKLLLAALRGGTDEELSDELAISLSAVKKAWSSIYDRATDHLPDSILTPTEEERLNGDRGKQKKQRLLAYLREHPEELRPYARVKNRPRS
jgi:DNA-binding CsgD family transcriptional regulator